MRMRAYVGTSIVLAAGCLIRAFNERPNYYSATVYLSQSNACILILTNLALVCIISFIYGFQRLVYGPLRSTEIESLSEKAWYAVLDTLFAMPSLRDDIGGWLLIAFTLLLAGKVWAWIAEGRVDMLEQQPPADARRFHARISTALVISVLFDIYMCRYCFRTVMHDARPGMMVIFAFEYAILTIFSLFQSGRYFLALYEAKLTATQVRQKIEERKAEIREERRRALREAGEDEATAVEPTDEDVDENEIDVPGWEEKRRYLFGLELATDAIKILTYSIFFTISITFIGFPMHAMRDAYMTIAAFTKRLQDYANYRRATDDMNTRYPDATAGDLSNDNTCIVCREIMSPWQVEDQAADAGQTRRRPMNEGLRAKKLPCGHILHLRCLKAWLERQQSCPTCRRPVIARAAPEAAGGQNGAGGPPGPGGNGGQAGNHDGAAQAPQQRRRNRMRWLNMGPIRVGFYNGPANQVQQALGAQGGHGRINASAALTEGLPAHEYLRRAEMRLLHDAHNLDVDRAQLINVRALEAELGRLRALRTTSDDTASMFSSQTQQATASAPSAASAPSQPSAPSIPPTAAQQYQIIADPRTGAYQLPPGFTLPEGWTLAPLHRIGGAPSLLGQSQAGTTSQASQVPQAGTPTTSQVVNSPQAAPAAARNVTNASTGPQSTEPALSQQSVPPAASVDAPASNEGQSSGEVPQTANHSTQPTATWNFPAAVPPSAPVDGSTGNAATPDGANGSNERTSDALTSNEHEEAEGSNSKGKGRLVEVEEVPDDGNA